MPLGTNSVQDLNDVYFDRKEDLIITKPYIAELAIMAISVPTNLPTLLVTNIKTLLDSLVNYLRKTRLNNTGVW